MSDQELTTIEISVLAVFREKYIEHGWFYSGCLPANSPKLKDLSDDSDQVWAAIDHLIQIGYLQQRNCQKLSYELTPAQRWELIESNDLSDYWQLVGEGPGDVEYSEIVHVRNKVEKGNSNA